MKFFIAWAAVVKAVDIMPLGDSLTRGAGSDPQDIGYRRPLYLKLVDGGYAVHFVGSQEHPPPDIIDDFDKFHEGYYREEANDDRNNWRLQ